MINVKNICLSVTMIVISLNIQACSPNLKKESISNNVVETKTVTTYKLPQAPNTKLNNKDLAGIDSNENGIRDDVEIWIYSNNEHPIERAIFAQIASAYQRILENKSDIKVAIDEEYKSIECESYWSLEAKDIGESFYISGNRNLTKEISEIILNTEDRVIAFDEYMVKQEKYENNVRDNFDLKKQCDFNAELLLQSKQVVVTSNDIVVQVN